MYFKHNYKHERKLVFTMVCGMQAIRTATTIIYIIYITICVYTQKGASMFYGYLEQVERLKEKIEEKDTSQVHFLDLRKDGTFIDADTKSGRG